MKKEYLSPDLKVILFQDVIITSSTPVEDDNDLPIQPD